MIWQLQLQLQVVQQQCLDAGVQQCPSSTLYSAAVSSCHAMQCSMLLVVKCLAAPQTHSTDAQVITEQPVLQFRQHTSAAEHR
jgi:organic hydroperoxide reductase OsmC/OhrA